MNDNINVWYWLKHITSFKPFDKKLFIIWVSYLQPVKKIYIYLQPRYEIFLTRTFLGVSPTHFNIFFIYEVSLLKKG